VQPGDDLALDGAATGQSSQSTFINLSLPVEPASSFYQLYSSCGSDDVRAAAGGHLFVELIGCRGRADMFVLSIGGGFFYLYREDVAIAEQAPVDFLPPYRAMERPTINVVDVPAPISRMSVLQSLIGEGRVLYDPRAAQGGGGGVMTIVNGAGSVNFDGPLPPEATTLTEVLPLDGGVGAQTVLVWGPPQATTTIDYGAARLRQYIERPHYEPTSHTIQWTEDTGGIVANTLLTSWGWTRRDLAENFQWQVLSPRGEQTVQRLPLLPAPFTPTTESTIVDPFTFISSAVAGGFGSVRTKLVNWSPGRPWPVDGKSGSVSYEDLLH